MRQTSENVSPMSNEGRNLYVVEHITDALLKLMKEQSFNDISISQICDEAGVGRASFYRNFENKEAVISRYLKKLLDEWQNKTANNLDLHWVEAIFSHYLENRDLCIMLYRHRLDRRGHHDRGAKQEGSYGARVGLFPDGAGAPK